MEQDIEGSGEEIFDTFCPTASPDEPRARGRAVARDMVHGSFWTLLAAVLGLPAAFLGNLLIARSLGPVRFGLLATYGALIGVASTVLNLGISSATAQWLAETPSDVPTEEQRRILRACIGWHSLIEGPALGIAGYLLLRSSAMVIWAPAVISLVVTQCLGTAVVVLTGTARNSVAAKIGLVTSVLSQAGAITTAALTHSAQATYVATLLAALVGPVSAVATLPSDFRRAFRQPILSLRLPSGFFVYALSSCGSSLVSTLVYGRSEIFVLQADGLRAVTGLFALATGLAGQLTVPMDSVMGPFLPAVTGLLARDRSRTDEVTRRSLRVAALLGAGTMAVGASAVFALLPVLYQSSFREASYPFLVLAIVSCFQSVGVPVGMLLMATRNAPVSLATNTAALAVDAAVAISLVPIVGIWGAVAANALSQLTGTGFGLVLLIRRLGVPSSSIVKSMAPLAIGLTATAGAFLVRMTVSGTAGGIGSVALAGAVLVLGLRLFPSCRLTVRDQELLEAHSPRPVRAAARLAFRILPAQ